MKIAHAANQRTLQQRYRCYYSSNTFAYFTKRESQILTLSKHLRPKQLAELYSLSTRSVEYHLSNIKMKLQVNKRKHMLHFAERYGFNCCHTKAEVGTLTLGFLDLIKLNNPSKSCRDSIANAIHSMNRAESKKLKNKIRLLQRVKRNH